MHSGGELHDKAQGGQCYLPDIMIPCSLVNSYQEPAKQRTWYWLVFSCLCVLGLCVCLQTSSPVCVAASNHPNWWGSADLVKNKFLFSYFEKVRSHRYSSLFSPLTTMVSCSCTTIVSRWIAPTDVNSCHLLRDTLEFSSAYEKLWVKKTHN